MNFKIPGSLCGALLTSLLLTFSHCDQKRETDVNFTRADSLTETYLTLQDAMVQVWNSMMHDDNRKLRAMRHLLHELRITSPEKEDELRALGQRLTALEAMRYDQHTMSDPAVVNEYDSASDSLVSELISLAETRREFAYNTTMQKLVDSIRAADQRAINYREHYDAIASRFNAFIERNRDLLLEVAQDSVGIRPLFRMTTE